MTELEIISDLNSCQLVPSKMEYFLRYCDKYYNDAFRPGQGTEAVLEMLRENTGMGVWLDVGSGPATLFWGLMLGNKIDRLDCSEISVEGLVVLDNFIRNAALPRCYSEVMSMYGIPTGQFEYLRSVLRRYLLFDALNPWPTGLEISSYGIITALGVFGLSTNASEYVKAFGYPRDYLKPGGVLIGANWIRSRHFIDQGNTDNRFVSPDLVYEAADLYGYHVSHLSKERIAGDENYDAVVVWALKKPLR